MIVTTTSAPASLRLPPLALARALQLRLRELGGRQLDPDWLVCDLRYLREVQRACRAIGSDEFLAWAECLEPLASAMAMPWTPMPRRCRDALPAGAAELDIEIDIDLPWVPASASEPGCDLDLDMDMDMDMDLDPGSQQQPGMPGAVS